MRKEYAEGAAVVRELIGRRVLAWGGNDPLRVLLFPMLVELEEIASNTHCDPAEEVLRWADALRAEQRRYNPPPPPAR